LSDSDCLPEPVLPGLFIRKETDASLLAGECDECATLTFPASRLCPQCQSRSIVPRMLSETGSIYSFTVVRARPPEYEGPVPFGLGLVDFPDGIRVFGVILADDLEQLTIGASVRTATLNVGSTPPRSTYRFELMEASNHG
jgi:uncharacterized OB-fold protein